MLEWAQRVARIALFVFIAYQVYHEAGPWTAAFCVLVLIAFEAQNWLTHAQAKFNDTVVQGLNAVFELLKGQSK